MKRRFLVLGFVVVCYSSVFGGIDSWVVFKKTNGLASDRVYSIAQDSKGNYWIGTVDGLSKYDGNQWTTYTINNRWNNKIDHIAVDLNDNVWIGGEMELLGAHMFDGTKFHSWTQAEGLPHEKVYSVAIDSKNNVWVGFFEDYDYWGEGCASFDGTKWITHILTFPYSKTNQNVIKAIVKDSKGNLWFGTSQGLAKFDGSSWAVFDKSNGLASQSIHDIAIDSKDNVWIATEGGGVSKFDGTNVTNYSTEDGLSKNSVNVIGVDAQDNVWVGYQNWGRPVGVDKFDGDRWRNYTSADGLSDNKVNAIFTDSKGIIWFGTYEGGVCRYSPPADILLSATYIPMDDVKMSHVGEVSFSIANKGNEPLIISNISCDNESFSVNVNSATIAPGQNQPVKITFRPTRIGVQIAQISIKSNDEDENTLNVIVQGKCLKPEIAMDSKYLNFGDTYIDSVSARTLTLRNTGNTDLHVDSISVIQSTTFVVEPTSCIVAAGDSSKINCFFRPGIERIYYDTLTVWNDDTIQTIMLCGKGRILSFINSSSGNITYKSKSDSIRVWFRTNYFDSTVRASVIYSIDGGATFNPPRECTLTANEYSAFLSPQPSGSIINYYFEITGSQGLSYLPAEGPASTFTLKAAYDADLDNNSSTDVFDLLRMLRVLSGSESNNGADINKDGKIDIYDLLSLLESLNAK